jgi:hypothetical protein
MPIRRYEPGEAVPFRGTYVLVGHYGEPAGVTVGLDAGGRLPFATADLEGPLWFVLVNLADENALAA